MRKSEEPNVVVNDEATVERSEGGIVQYVEAEGLAEGDRETLIEFTQIDRDEHSNGTAFQFDNRIELSNRTPANDCKCKCMDKMRNKMDYFQKRVLNEIAEFRQETQSSIRKLTEVVSRSLNIVLSEKAVEPAEISDELSEKYGGTFPVNDKDKLHAVNKRIKTETDLKTFVQLTLDKISNKDATKTARKMLSALCTVNCMSKFTWLGTKNKDRSTNKERFCDLESLIDIMAKIIEQRFPKCGAFNIIELVVKQRAKSAGEAVKENDKMENSGQHEPTTSTVSAPSTSNSLVNFEFSNPFVAIPFDLEEMLSFDK